MHGVKYPTGNCKVSILQVLYLCMYVRLDIGFSVYVTGTPYRYCTAVLCVLSGKLLNEGVGYYCYKIRLREHGD